jgi:hypothetical protein
MAICCAAVTERPGYWEPNKLNLETVREVSDQAMCGNTPLAFTTQANT